ncbi:hypothetical protein SAMN05661093_05067 [Kibdelosporangium aridum]|uniref:Uncharacterized protein n=1 Tax=Kibdelosporangium aridum TaxID=2030 RepID=A0A1W2EY02_KIBAR|nr:hypothetical protein SAMN05661093_05067 [Kibdelosporangium aridum]
MCSDEQHTTKPPSASDVKVAYETYCAAETKFLEVLTRYAKSKPDGADPLFNSFPREAAFAPGAPRSVRRLRVER